MDKILKNKLALIGILTILIVGVIAGFIFFQNTKKIEEIVDNETIEEQAIEISPEDIELILTPNSNNTEVVMTINDTSKFSSFEYEMNYDTEVDGEVVPRGAIGSGEVEDGKPIKREITIGTCSSGKCKYDTGVTKISFIIRLNLNDGQTGIVKKDLELK